MPVAAIYDIHANLPALEAVIQDVRNAQVEMIVVGGDVVPGPMPRETFDLLLDLDIPTVFITGNGDREVLERLRGFETDWYRSSPEQWREPVNWSAQQLTLEDEKLMAGWSATHQVTISGIGEVIFCHGTPRSDTEIFTRLTPEDRLVPLFEKTRASLVVCGHTHMQFDRLIGGVRVVNAGSVGMPYGEAGAHWLLLGPDVRFQHTIYDLTRAADRIRHTSYPQAQDFADNNVLRPPSEEKVLMLFSGIENI